MSTNSEQNTKNYPSILREAIHELRVKDQDFAAAGGVSKQTLSGYLNGRATPNGETLSKWVKHYNINPGWLLRGERPVLGSPCTQPAIVHAKSLDYRHDKSPVRIPTKGGGFADVWLSNDLAERLGNPQGLVGYRVRQDQAGLVVGDLAVVDETQKKGQGLFAVEGPADVEWSRSARGKEVVGRVVYLLRERVDVIGAVESELAADIRAVKEAMAGAPQEMIWQAVANLTQRPADPTTLQPRAAAGSKKT